jgi:hypothetical protein
MDWWNVLEYGAWGVSVLLLGWMLLDAIQVNRDYDEDLLTSSREGELEGISEKHDISEVS